MASTQNPSIVHVLPWQLAHNKIANTAHLLYFLSASHIKLQLFCFLCHGHRCSLYNVFQWDNFSTEQFVNVFFSNSVKHKIVFALQCISMAFFSSSWSRLVRNMKKRRRTEKYTKLYDFIFFNKCKIVLKFRKKHFGTVTNSKV